MRKILENFISSMIFLVLIQTILEEVAVIAGFSLTFRETLIYTGFLFDLTFSIEFITRLTVAAKKNRVSAYLTEGLGWIDFSSSLPLLLLNSGPMAYFLITRDTFSTLNVIGILNVLKIAKIIRVSRILRIMRFLKLLRNIRFIKSRITQKHTNFLIAAVISFIILTVIMLNLSGIWGTGSLKELKKQNYNTLLSQTMSLSMEHSKDFLETLDPMMKKDSSIFSVEFDDKIVYTKKGDLSLIELNYVDSLSYNRVRIYYIDYLSMEFESRFNMAIILIILMLIAGILFLYSRKFAVEVSDTVQVVEKGFTDPDYFLRLRENPGREDEIEDLAKSYNEIWLPAKMKYKDEIYGSENQEFNREVEGIELEDFLEGEDLL
jgi:hypothetical protein